MILLLIGAGAGATACSSPSASSVADGWQCAPDEVPEGVVTRCTSSASASAPSTGGDPTAGGFGSNASTGTGGVVQPRTYGAPPPEADAGAPAPPSTPSGSDSSSTGDGSTSYDCAPGMTGPDCPGAAPTPPAPTPGAPVDECSYTPDLPYCGAPSTPAAPPASSSGASGGASGGDAGGWQCTKGAMGDKTCTTAPTCSPGTHAAPCGACVDDDSPLPADCVPPSQGGCWVTGGGFITPGTEHLTYGGNAKPMKQGYVSGHWNHLDHATQDHLNGRPEYIFCRVDAGEPGPGQPGGNKSLVTNQVYFGGHAKWGQGGGVEGFWFDVVAEDHGNGHQSAAKGQDPDYYHLTVRKMDDPAGKVSGPIVYDQKGDVVGGKIQIHPPNAGHDTASPPAPPWVTIETAP